jgi:hypothetical protein
MRRWLQVVAPMLMIAAAAPTPARADPMISRLCADVIDLDMKQVRYRVTVDWNEASPADFYRYDIVALDSTGVYYPQYRRDVLKPGLQPSTKPFIETASLYPLDFSVAGFSRAAAEAFDRGCRRKASERICYVTGNEPGVRIFAGSTWIPDPSRNLLCSGEAPTGRRSTAARSGEGIGVALVLGNNRYAPADDSLPEDGTVYPANLTSPLGDAQAVREALMRWRYRPIINGPADADWKTMNDQIVYFGERARDPAVSYAIFYFSGHGFRFEGETYLVPSGARLNLNEDLAALPADVARKLIASSAIPLSQIVRELPDRQNGFNLIILDTCLDNPWGVSHRGPNPYALVAVDRSGGPDPVIGKRNTVVVYSTRVGTSARDHSPYSATVAKWLARGGVPVTDWVRGMTGEAVALLGEGQQPSFAGTVAPGFCLDSCSQ